MCPAELYLQPDLLYQYTGCFNVCVLCSSTFVCMCFATSDKCSLATFGDCSCNFPVQAWTTCFKVKTRIPGGIYSVSVEASVFIGTN